MCTKDKNCKDRTHWSVCPKAGGRLNDDATYNRSNVTYDTYMAIGWYDMLPSERGDSMG